MAKFKIDQDVRVAPVVIQGPVRDIRYDKDLEDIVYLVEFVGADQETHTRWFTETELESV